MTDTQSNDDHDGDTSGVALTPGHGAVYSPSHYKRDVKIYAIEEYELESISDLNSNVSLWTSIGSFFAALFAGCVWDLMSASDPASFNAIGFVVGCSLASLFSFIQAWRYRSRRQSRLATIKGQSSVVA